MSLVPYKKKRSRALQDSRNSLSSRRTPPRGGWGQVLRYANPWQLSYPIIYGTGGADVANTARDVSNMDFDSAWRRVNDRNFRVGGVARGFQRGLESVGNSMRSGIRSVGRSLGYHWKDEPMTPGELETGVRNPFAKNRLKAQPRLGLPAGKKGVPRIIAKLPMKRKYHTTGSYGGRFGGKFKKKTSSAAYSGVVLKGERQSSLTDAAAVYVGHTSAPVYAVLRALGWSIARLVAKKMGQDFTSFQSSINMPMSTASSSLTVTIQYRTTPTGVMTSFAWEHENSTWAALGDNIIGHILALCTDSLYYFEVVRIKFAQGDATLAEALPTVVLYGENLKISLGGFSKLKVQNNTVSTSGDTAANEQADDVANNPLVGKRYVGYGQSHVYKFNNDFTVSTPMLHYASTDGYATLTPSSATSFETAMANFMLKIPNHKALTNIKGYSNIKLAPGEIKSSVVKCGYKMKLNKWIKFLFPIMRGATSLGGIPSSGGSHAICNLGTNALIGVEHMLHSGTEPDIVISYQIDWTVKAIATHKKKQFCNADFQSATNTLIVGA